MARIALMAEFVEINVMRKSGTDVEGAVRLGRASKAELHSPKYLPDNGSRAALDWPPIRSTGAPQALGDPLAIAHGASRERLVRALESLAGRG